MTDAHDELVTLWTSGEGPERDAALEHVRSCEVCQAAAARLGRAIDALEGGTVGRIAAPAPAGGVQKLLQRAKSGRLSFFIPRVAELFDLSTEAARELLERAERDEFEAFPSPGVRYIPVTVGSKVPEAMTALVKLEPGAVFPMHPHLGHEEVWVLEGGYRDSGGTEVWRGEVHKMAPHTEHEFRAFDGVGCICASVARLSED